MLAFDSRMHRFFSFIFLCISIKAMADAFIPEMIGENGYVERFRMFDNVYYVGDRWVSSYIVETSSGLGIIDTLDFPHSKWIPKNLEKLGLNYKKVTHIFVTHGNSDHVDGAEFLQSLCGSKIVMSEKALELSKDKGIFLPPVVELFAEDLSTFLVGDTEFKFYITPGYTEGDMSIEFVVKDNGKSYRTFILGRHGTNFQNPGLAEQFMDSVDRIKGLALQGTQVTVNLSNHPHKNNFFENREISIKDGSSNPFII